MRPRHQTESIGACWADPSRGPMLALDPQNAERQSVARNFFYRLGSIFQFIKEEVKITDFSKVLAGQVLE